MQTERTKNKIVDNTDLLKRYLENRGFIVDEDTRTVLFNALDWTADDVYAQCMGTDH